MTISFVPQPPGLNCCVQACCAMLTNMTLEAEQVKAVLGM